MYITSLWIHTQQTLSYWDKAFKSFIHNLKTILLSSTPAVLTQRLLKPKIYTFFSVTIICRRINVARKTTSVQLDLRQGRGRWSNNHTIIIKTKTIIFNCVWLEPKRIERERLYVEKTKDQLKKITKRKRKLSQMVISKWKKSYVYWFENNCFSRFVIPNEVVVICKRN